MRTSTTSISAHLIASTSLTRPALLAALVAGAVVLPTSPSLALDDSTLPFGETVVGGHATFDRSTTNVLNINQSTDRVVINWKGFNIGSSATTQFYQPDSGSLAINRVQSASTDPTRILGSLKANGRVMVLDRNGVLFGANSRVDVGGIVASTGDVDTAAVMRGDTSLVLTGLGTSGSVVNDGLVNVADGGLAAFVAPTVRNNGVINARLGKVALAAGTESATVDLYGDGLVSLALSKSGEKVLAENSGAINAESGTVLLTASAAKDVVDTVVNMSGVVNASSATMVGGSIVLSGGEGGKVKVSGKVSANGKGGGKVNVKGESVEVTSDASISADGAVTGNGGSIYIVANKDAVVYGAISAEGGSTAGDGGFVEVSGHGTLDLHSRISTKAYYGTSGTLLIDPATMTFHNGTYQGSTGGISYMAQDYVLSLSGLNGLIQYHADAINVGTDDVVAGVGNGSIDLSHIGLDETNGNIELTGFSEINFNKNLTVGNGSVTVITPTLNLASTIYGLDSGSVAALGDSRLNSAPSLSTINVINPNAKINQAVAFANGYETINVGSGTYAESVLVNKSDLTLNGFSAAHITPAASAGFDVTANYVTIRGFEISGARDGIRVTNATNSILSTNVIHDIDGDGIRIENGDHAQASHNDIYDIRSTGEFIGSGIHSINTNGATYLSNTIHDTQWDGIRVDRGRGVLATHNTISDVTRTGIFLGNTGSALVSNNIISGAGRSGVNVSGGTFAIISRNTISHTGLNGVLLSYAKAAAVLGNNISRTGLNGIYADNSTDAFVDSNRIYNTGANGISFYNSARGFIERNVIGVDGANQNIAGDGVRLERSNLSQINDNQISNIKSTAFNVGSGIQSISSNDVQMKRNEIRDTGWDGIRIDHGDNVVAAENDIDNVARTGIFLQYGGNGQLLRNTISGAGRSGFNIAGGHDNLIQGNNIDHTGLNGVLLSYALRSTIDGNMISFTGQNGVYAANSAHTKVINNNQIHDTAQNGVAVIDSANALVDGNTIWNTGLSGVFVDPSPSARITGNRINNTGSHGVTVLDSTGALISGNFIGTDGSSNNIKGDGVHLNNAGSAQVLGNQITNAKSTGFNVGSGVQALNSTNVTIDGNTIWNTEWDGVRMELSSGATVQNNSIDDVLRTGVFFGSISDGQILNNLISNVGRSGVNISLGSNNVVTENSIVNTGLNGVLLSYAASTQVTNNDVRNAGQNGVFADHSIRTTVSGNNIYNSTNHGITTLDSSNAQITGNRVEYSQNEGIHAERGENVDITNNKVKNSGGNGISSVNVHDILISENEVRHSGVEGFGNGIYVYDDADYGNPTINILNNNVKYSSLDGIHVDAYGVVGEGHGYESLINVNDNIVAESGDDGIDVSYFHAPYYYGEGSVPLGAELIESGEEYGLEAGINVLRNAVTNSTDDGIHVGVSEGYYEGSARFAPEAIYYGGDARYNIIVANNTVTNDTGSGGSESSTMMVSEGSTGYGYGDGIQVDVYMNPWSGSVSDTQILNNNVSNFNQNGVYVAGQSHSFVDVAGNTLTNNTVGARFESGLIDLTGETNVINGGSIGLLFSPYLTGYDYGYDDISAFAAFIPPAPIYATMALVSDTIGTTEFNGQSDFFVRLENGAFFDPGRPTLLDGLRASYNGFRPSDVGGALTQPQYDYLESMFWHYNDDPAVGLFFFGAVPTAPLQIAQEDIFNLFGAFDPNSPSGGLIISGLPSIGGGQVVQFRAGGTSGAGGTGNPFADITPAAGDEEGTDVAQTSNIQNIEPAAGGDGVSDAACWNDATNYLGQGTPVSYSFGDQASTLLKKAASCGTGQTTF